MDGSNTPIPFSPYVARLAPLISSIDGDEPANGLTRTELDSHANMVVVGKHSTIFDDTGKTCTVNAFSESAGKLDNVPFVDAVIAYDCPYQCKTFLLLMRNVLFIPELEINLLPPFIVREAGIHIDECPKSQISNPTVDNHSICLPSNDLRILFKLMNTFSYFDSRKPTEDELASCDKIFIPPDSPAWNPCSTHFSLNENVMLDADGNAREIEPQDKFMLNEEEVSYFDLPSTSSVEAHIDSVLVNLYENVEAHIDFISANSFKNCNPKVATVSHSSAKLNAEAMVEDLNERIVQRNLSMAIGSMSTSTSPCPLFTTTLDELEDKFSSTISSVAANGLRGVSASFLEKIWHISPE